MATPLQSREIGIKAALPEAPIAPGAVLTPEQQASAKVREHVRKSTEPSPLTALSEAAKSLRKPPAGSFERLLDSNIGVERKADGKRQLTPSENIRKDTAVKYEKLARELAEKGYDGLSAGDKIEARNLVNLTLSSLPEVNAVLPPAGPDRDAILEKILRDENQTFIGKVRAVYLEKTSDSNKHDSTSIEASKKQYDEAKAAENLKKAEKERTEKELKQVESDLDKFSTGKPKAVDLEKAIKRAPTFQRQLEEKQDELEGINDQLEALKVGRRRAIIAGTATTTFDTQIQALTPDKRKLEREIENVNTEIAKKGQLEEEKKELQGKQKSLTEKLDSVKPELEALSKARLEAQAEFAGLKVDRAYVEQAFADSLQDIIPEATLRYLEENIKLADEQRVKLLNEEIAKTGDKGEKALLQQMLERWQNTDLSPIKGNIRDDFNNIMNRAPAIGGPDNLISRMLNAEVTAGRLTMAEANERRNDPEFLKKMGPQVTEGLLRQYIKIDKLSSRQAKYIGNTEWGKGMILQAFTKNEAAMSELNALREKGLIKGSPLEFIKSLKGPSLLRLLLLLLGSAAAITFGGPALLKFIPS